MLGHKLVKEPLEANFVIKPNGLDNNDDLLVNITEFQKLIGKLIYLTITGSDISYSV